MLALKAENAGTYRGRSGNLWRHVPNELAFLPGAYPGSYLAEWDDFTKVDDRYTVTQATSGTFATDGALGEGGYAKADAGATTTTQGPNIQEAPWVAPELGHELVFEARIVPAAIGTPGNTFIGLASTDTTIVAASAVTVPSFIAFYGMGSNSLSFGMQKAGGGITKVDGVATLEAGVAIRLGFRIDPNGDVVPYVNGREVAGKTLSRTLAATYLPTAILGRSLVVQSRGTTQPTVSIDYWGTVKVKEYRS